MAERLGTQLQSGGLEQSIHTGLLGSGLFGGASLDLNFAVTKNVGPLVTFTRASSGTFVDSAGVLQTATTNLLLRSEEFDNASWSKLNATVNANATTSPSGTIAADEIIEDSAASSHYVTNTYSSTSGVSYTYSCYVKAAQRSFCFLVANGAPTLVAVSVNLTTGEASTAVGSPTNIISTAVGNGWYRVSFTYVSGLTGLIGHEVRLSTDGLWANRSYTGNGTGSVFAWGAQLEQSSTVGEYIPTTSITNSAPRFDHNPTTGESLGLLVEEQRTNLRPFSDAILVANTYVASVATLTTVTTATPTASTTASLFTLNAGANTGNTTDGFNFGSDITLTNSTQHTQSLFVKPASATVLRLRSNTSGLLADFTLTGNGTAPSLSADLQGAFIVPFPNGWYRVSWTFTTTTSVPGNRGDYWTIKTNVADGTSGLYVVGAQLEAGAFPTSYIPTTTATVTRAADVPSITGSAFSSWYNQSEGTVFAEGNSYGLSASTFPSFAAISDGTSDNRLQYAYITASLGGYLVRSGGSTVVELYPAVTASLRRAAFAAKANDFAVTYNGATPTIDTSGAMPVGVNQMQIGNLLGAGSTNNFFGTIKRLTYWPQRLSNSTLQAITQ